MLAPFMVYSAATAIPTVAYSGVCALEADGQKGFYLTWMARVVHGPPWDFISAQDPGSIGGEKAHLREQLSSRQQHVAPCVGPGGALPPPTLFLLSPALAVKPPPPCPQPSQRRGPSFPRGGAAPSCP